MDDLKTRQPVLRASIQELETGLAKVKLANSVGCSALELLTIQIECPKEKMGNIIGKQGVMLQKIMDMHKVSIDVNKETTVLSITGNECGVESAKRAIDAIATSIEVEVDLPSAAVTYLTSPRIDVFATMKEKYNDIFLDLPRNTGKAIIRGAPDQVAEAKRELLDFHLISRELTLIGREFFHLLGPKGATIEALVNEFKVVIDTTKSKVDDTASAIITGPTSHVESCMEKIRELLDTNREVTVPIEVHLLLKNILLAESGKCIKDLQRKVNEVLKRDDEPVVCFLSFPKDHQARSELLVKTKQAFIDTAVALTNDGIKKYEELIVAKTIDMFAVPGIIGKGGDTIKELTEGKPFFLEVDREACKVMIGATTAEGRDTLVAKVNQILDDNTILRISGDPNVLSSQYREFTRSKTKAALQDLAWTYLDETAKVIVLRAKKEDIEQAKSMVEEFLANNWLDEIAVLDEDFDAMLAGGKNSKIMSLAQKLEVNLFADRNKGVITIRGPPLKVGLAKSALDTFLNGGNGQGVAKLSVTSIVVGAVVGKGGKTRKELEEKYGVSVNISKEPKISIRGPSEEVAKCRIEILKMIASSRIAQEIMLTAEQKASLEKKDAWKRISQQTTCQVTMDDSKVTIRGVFYDVRDAVSLVNELLTGELASSIELGSSQYARLSATCRDPSHMQRIEKATETKISLVSGRIEVSGKRSNVKKAKLQIYDFLAFVCPGELERLGVSQPIFNTVGSGSTLADVLANSGVSIIFLDRIVGSIVILDCNIDKVRAASNMVRERIEEAERLAFVMKIAPDEAWLLSYIIGQNGGRIQSLRKGSRCQIDVSKETRIITITGTSEEDVASLREKLTALVEKGRRENIFIKIPDAALPAFVGRGSQNLQGWSKTYGVEIQRIRGSTQFKIVGEETKAESFRKFSEEWLALWAASNASVEMTIEKQQVAIVLGEKGSSVQAIEKEFDCRIDVDRTALTITIKGGNNENRQGALLKMKTNLKEHEAVRAAAAAERKEKAITTSIATAMRIVEDPPTPEVASPLEESGAKEPSREAMNYSAYPSMPIGLQQAPNKRNGKKAPSRHDPVVEGGTDQGWDLFNLLIS